MAVVMDIGLCRKADYVSLLQNSAARCSCASAKRRFPVDGASQKRLYKVLQAAHVKDLFKSFLYLLGRAGRTPMASGWGNPPPLAVVV